MGIYVTNYQLRMVSTLFILFSSHVDIGLNLIYPPS
jgi:hypothetical protein